MKITKGQLKRIIAEEHAIVYGKKTRKTRRTTRKTNPLNEWTKRVYKMLREAGYNKKAAKKNAMLLRERRKRNLLK